MIAKKVQIPAKAALLLTIFFLLACEVFYYRNIFFSDLLIGDVGDGILTNFIAEHWFRFFSGKEAFRDLNIFFPVKNTLSYSDTLFIFGVVHSLLRLFGADMFTAYKFTLILIHMFGTFSMLYLLRVKMKLSFPSCVIGIILFAYSYASFANGHTQLYAYFLLPFLLILIYGFFENLHNARYKRLIYGCASIVSFMAIIFNSSYTGYFFFILLIMFLIVFLIICTHKHVQPLKRIFSYLRTNFVEIGVFVCVGILSMCPFLYVYLPAMKEFGSRSWQEICYFLLTPLDFINFAKDSLLYGNISKDFPHPHDNGELKVGFPFLTVIAFFSSLIYVWRKLPSKMKKFAPANTKKTQKKEKTPASSVFRYEYIILASMGIAVLLILFIILKFGETDSLWYIFYSIVPGASALRAVSRICQTLMLPVALIVAFFADAAFARISNKALNTITICFAVGFAVLEYTWSGGVFAVWSKSSMQSVLAEIPPPPAQCEVMYLTGFEKTSPNVVFFTKSWAIADHFDLKTIGGYSGQYPRGWNLHCAPEDYDKNARNWVAAHELQNVYSYNLDTMQWQAID